MAARFILTGDKERGIQRQGEEWRERGRVVKRNRHIFEPTEIAKIMLPQHILGSSHIKTHHAALWVLQAPT